MKGIIICIFSSLVCIRICSQPVNSIYENNSLVSFEKYFYSKDYIFHTSVRPYSLPEMRAVFNYDSVINSCNIGKFKKKRALNLIFNRNLILVDNRKYSFTLDPVFDFGAGYDFSKKWSAWNNTRGFILSGSLGKEIAFSSAFYESQSKPPLWIRNYADSRLTMPGQGGVKNMGSDAFDYSNSSGYISWSPSRIFNFKLGYGKNFWGDGYRSLILSDFSSNYPFLMITSTFWKIKYINLYSQFSHPDIIAYTHNNGSSLYAKKFSTMHYLSYSPGKHWNISLFESIVWQKGDSVYNRGFELSYLNPVIFFRPVEFNLGSFDNELIGLNLRYTPADMISFYCQYVIDDMKTSDFFAGNGAFANKYAVQAGFRTFDLFGITNLNMQAEFNSIKPYTYGHRNVVQNYSNAREPLAHPSGANIREVVLAGRYNYKRLYLNVKYIWAEAGLDSAGINFGRNIFLTNDIHPYDYGNRTCQGLKTMLNQLDITASFLINPSTNMNIFIGATFRGEKNSLTASGYSYFNFGFRTSLRNLYHDFL